MNGLRNRDTVSMSTAHQILMKTHTSLSMAAQRICTVCSHLLFSNDLDSSFFVPLLASKKGVSLV